MSAQQVVNLDYYRNRKWNFDAAWPSEYGEHWSDSWGSVDLQWRLSIEPRLRPWLGGRVLEVGCGRGRWAKYFADYVGLDYNPACCEYTSKRWNKPCVIAVDGEQWNIESESARLVWSWDSLVYSEPNSIDMVLVQAQRVLQVNGAAVLHYTGDLRPGFGDLQLYCAERVDWPTGAANGWIATYVPSADAVLPTVMQNSTLRAEMSRGIVLHSRRSENP